MTPHDHTGMPDPHEPDPDRGSPWPVLLAFAVLIVIALVLR